MASSQMRSMTELSDGSTNGVTLPAPRQALPGDDQREIGEHAREAPQQRVRQRLRWRFQHVRSAVTASVRAIAASGCISIW